MTDGSSLVNIGEISKPATVLIEKISDAVGGIAKPWQIRRVAKAEAEADKIRAIAHLEIDELQRRALQRFVAEEAKKQSNIEEITAKALPQVNDNAKPENIEDDWITNFFDKCKLISDDEMQTLWSKVLAGEANNPGTYSKRTVNFIGSLDKSDAFLFQSLCSFAWLIGDAVPIIYDINADIYEQHDIDFGSFKHLNEIGLISFESLSGFSKIHLPKKIRVRYYGTPIDIEFEKEDDNRLEIGHVLLSKTGQELAPICGSKPIPEFFEFIIEKWTTKDRLCVSSPIRVRRK